MKFLLCFIIYLFPLYISAQEILNTQDMKFSNHKYRAWWDVTQYDIKVNVNIESKFFSGSNKIYFKTISSPSEYLQIDLLAPMHIDSVFFHNQKLNFKNYEDYYLLDIKNIRGEINSSDSIDIFFSGNPIIAKKAPWDGGVIFTKDSLGIDWVSMAYQDKGVAVWLPSKNLVSDEPNNGYKISINTPNNLVAVANGKLQNKKSDKKNTVFTFVTTQTINPYDITFSIGNYKSLTTKYLGQEHQYLNITYSLLQNKFDSKMQYLDNYVVKMLGCFENWFGKYPFYEDGYQIIETPFLGMEHQSGIAYGNGFKEGYEGKDLSKTGIGLHWDFIVIHESGHEWFGNSVSAEDIADNWIHEGFTCYSETIFTECTEGKDKAFEYCRGEWNKIKNDKPIIGIYGKGIEGSGDMYYKGAAILQMIRMMMNDDEKFKAMLKGINARYYHKNVKSADIENYISSYTGLQLHGFFDQYLRSTKIPLLVLKSTGKKLKYEWQNINSDFQMKMKIYINGKENMVNFDKNKGTFKNYKKINSFEIDKNYLIKIK